MDPASSIVLCGSLSLHPVSLGAAMHSAGYAAVGLPWVYVPFAMTSDRLESALLGMRALGIRGLGVSMPFKIEVLPLLDRVDALADAIGAVNTIVNDDGTLTGFNTDAAGAVGALEEAVGPLKGCRCLVLGGGGAARAVAAGLASEGADVCIANRTASKAEAIAAAVGCRAQAWDEAMAAEGFDIVVNATSAGMDRSAPGHGASSSASALDALAIRPSLVVMDIVYKPIRTRLLERARGAGARTIHGGRMLLHQAARQFELYTGCARSRVLEPMNRALQIAVEPGSV